MDIGLVGLGKMGGNMVHRIRRDSDHDVVAFDFNAHALQAAAGHGATPATTLEALVQNLEKPRMVWLMVPSGDPTQQTIDTLAGLLEEGDTIVCIGAGSGQQVTGETFRFAFCDVFTFRGDLICRVESYVVPLSGPSLADLADGRPQP